MNWKPKVQEKKTIDIPLFNFIVQLQFNPTASEKPTSNSVFTPPN
jgi:hypothetical protein